MHNMAKWSEREPTSYPSLAKMLGRIYTCIVKATSRCKRLVDLLAKTEDIALSMPLTTPMHAKGDSCRMHSRSER
jgi:hypothetical protein